MFRNSGRQDHSRADTCSKQPLQSLLEAPQCDCCPEATVLDGLGYLVSCVIKSLQGGLLLMATGLAGVVARELWHHGLEWAKRRLLVRCELDNRDDAYRYAVVVEYRTVELF